MCLRRLRSGFLGITTIVVLSVQRHHQTNMQRPCPVRPKAQGPGSSGLSSSSAGIDDGTFAIFVAVATSPVSGDGAGLGLSIFCDVRYAVAAMHAKVFLSPPPPPGAHTMTQAFVLAKQVCCTCQWYGLSEQRLRQNTTVRIISGLAHSNPRPAHSQ